MNWLQFITYVTGGYFFYYLVNILIDLRSKAKNQTGEPAMQALIFHEAIAPVNVERLVEELPEKKNTEFVTEKVELAKPKKEPVIIESGGLSLKDFFDVARQESIIYTRSVSF